MAIFLHLLLYFALGAAVGFCGGLFGLGGGIVAIPILGIAFGMKEQLAQGTSLVMVVPNTLIGLVEHYRKGKFDLRMASVLALSALVFTLPFAHVATHIKSRDLRIAFAIFLLVVAAYLAWRTYGPRHDRSTRRLPWPWSFPIGAASGTLSGFFSIGAATFTVAATTWAFGLDQVLAQGMALAVTAPGILGSIVIYGFNGLIDWPVGIAMAAGGVATVSWGVKLSYRLPDKVLRGLFIAFLLLSTIGLIVRSDVK